MSEYSIMEHRHRFAAWAASRAASVKQCRFKVEEGFHLIQATGLPELIRAGSLPAAEAFDADHRAWRERIVVEANRRKLQGMTHGIAAKLINVYLKGAVVCAGCEGGADYVHPPVDSLLLQSLHEKDAGGLRARWAELRLKRWSHFDSADYQQVIDGIRQVLHGAPLWAVESHWRGYR